LIGWRDPRSWLTVKAADLPLGMLAVMRAVYVRFGVTFQAGRISFPSGYLCLPSRSELFWLVESACPRTEEDYQMLQSAGARAWNATFPDMPFRAADLDVREVTVRMFALIGMYLCSDRSRSTCLPESFQLDQVSVQAALQNAFEVSDDAIRHVFKVDGIRIPRALMRAKELEKFSKTLCDPGASLCGICGLATHLMSHPFSLSPCELCEKALCSLCICVIFGAHEIVNVMRKGSTYRCPCCRMEERILSLKQDRDGKQSDVGASRPALPRPARRSRSYKRRETDVPLPPLIVSSQVSKVLHGLEPSDSKRDFYTRFACYCDHTNRIEFGPRSNTTSPSSVKFCLVCKGTNALPCQESSTDAETTDAGALDASSRGDSDHVGCHGMKVSSPLTDGTVCVEAPQFPASRA
jgi:hypothetical protein